MPGQWLALSPIVREVAEDSAGIEEIHRSAEARLGGLRRFVYTVLSCPRYMKVSRVVLLPPRRARTRVRNRPVQVVRVTRFVAVFAEVS